MALTAGVTRREEADHDEDADRRDMRERVDVRWLCG
jgi:hypothetical protein